MAEDAARSRGTQTSNFGVGRRESHDASPFYGRFTAPELSEDDEIAPLAAKDEIWCGDAREMDRHGEVADGSVALVVTSPPYFAGKAYEEAMGEGHVPGSYADYLEMLHDVFSECKRKLQPGGRIAVNVANLGRKPYRSLSADVTWILQDRLKLLLRGEIIWRKAEGAGGSCAWGSFQSPANPVLRDTTERVIVASKGRFDRAKSAQERQDRGWPSAVTISVDEFLDSTLDVWNRGERDPSWSSCAVSGGAAGEAHPPLHLQGGSRPRPVHGCRFDRGCGRQHLPALRGLRHRGEVCRAGEASGGRGPEA